VVLTLTMPFLSVAHYPISRFSRVRVNVSVRMMLRAGMPVLHDGYG